MQANGTPADRGIVRPFRFPMSLLAALVFVVLWRGVTTRPHRIGIVAGYLAASPVALVGSLVGGLVLPPVWGTMLYGGVP